VSTLLSHTLNKDFQLQHKHNFRTLSKSAQCRLIITAQCCHQRYTKNKLINNILYYAAGALAHRGVIPHTMKNDVTRCNGTKMHRCGRLCTRWARNRGNYVMNVNFSSGIQPSLLNLLSCVVST